MKKVVLALLTIVVALSAVEWEVEQVPDDNQFYRVNPKLALDEQGNPYILFVERMEGVEQGSLKVTTKESGEWVERLVSPVTYGFFEEEIEGHLSYCSFAVDENGNFYVAFTDFNELFSDTMNLYVVTDTSGTFEVNQLTDDGNYQLWPVIALGESKPTLAYTESDYDEELAIVKYGSITNSGNLLSEVIDTAIIWGLDFIRWGQYSLPYAFFSDDSAYICRSTPCPDGWATETLSDTFGVLPSACVDTSGRTHVAFRTGESLEEIFYLTDIGSNVWEEEYVAQGCKMEAGLFSPCVAADYEDTPHIAWVVEIGGSLDIHYAAKTDEGWMEEAVTSDPDNDEWPGSGRFFTIDAQGYGHLVYSAWDDVEDAAHIFYLKSKHPLCINESPPQRTPLGLEVIEEAVRFSLPQAGPIRLDLYDATGRRVCCIASGVYESGEHSVPINQAELSAGVYFVRMEAGGHSACAKFVVTH
ncbi:MAG: T9SS type A sorting domain-containing protein [Candidatus Stahlbacteria bacterium]|nr:MAG: T9SS type A sorting domain-containing protein [Candidatus Stahlbacteria bacterium]